MLDALLDRTVVAASGGMYMQRLDLRDLTWEGGYRRHIVHANAKRAQVMLAAHLATRWPAVPIASMHPGWVETDAVRVSMPVFRMLTSPILRSTDQGADTLVQRVFADTDAFLDAPANTP